MSERVVVVNASKMNYDHALDFSILSNDVQVYDNSTNTELIKRIQGARVVVTKEISVTAELLSQFPDTVKLIVEAGTGLIISTSMQQRQRVSLCATFQHTVQSV